MQMCTVNLSLIKILKMFISGIKQLSQGVKVSATKNDLGKALVVQVAVYLPSKPRGNFILNNNGLY